LILFSLCLCVLLGVAVNYHHPLLACPAFYSRPQLLSGLLFLLNFERLRLFWVVEEPLRMVVQLRKDLDIVHLKEVVIEDP